MLPQNKKKRESPALVGHEKPHLDGRIKIVSGNWLRAKVQTLLQCAHHPRFEFPIVGTAILSNERGGASSRGLRGVEEVGHSRCGSCRSDGGGCHRHVFYYSLRFVPLL